MNPLHTIGIVTVVFATGFSSGWITNNWRHDAEELAAQTAAEEAFNTALIAVNGISAKLQETTDALDKKRMMTTKEIFHETTKIEYRCPVPESGRLLYNNAAAETSATREP